MFCRPTLLLLSVIVLLFAADSATAQSGYYGPRGYRSSLSGGYSYTAPRYSVATPGYVFGSTARGYLGGGYRRVLWSPGYLSNISIPRLSDIQPQYNAAYRYDRGAPALLYAPVGSTRYLPTFTRTYGFNNYAQLPLAYRPAIYRPYVTVSHYLYAPTYVSAAYAPPVTYGAVYGSYGYSAVLGY